MTEKEKILDEIVMNAISKVYLTSDPKFVSECNKQAYELAMEAAKCAYELNNADNDDYYAFDIDKAIDGQPIMTRDGRTARLISTNLRNHKYPLAVAVEDKETKEEEVYSYAVTGEAILGEKNRCDLVMVPF